MEDEHEVTVGFEPFSWAAIQEEAMRLGVSIEELVRFSVLYYLADIDSGRIARNLPLSHCLGERPAVERT